MSETHTTRTDKEAWKTATREEVVWASFARQLERELTSARQTIAQKDVELRALREAIMEARNALATIRSGPTACSGYINDMADASKWLDDALSAPSPSAVVPNAVTYPCVHSVVNYCRVCEEFHAPKGNQ